MALYERIKQSAKERKISITNLEKQVGFGNGTIGKWRDSIPQADKLYLVAKFLGRSVEYLLTGIEETSCRNNGNILTNSINESPNSVLLIHGEESPLSKQELELILTYRELGIKEQAELINFLLGLKK